MNLFWTSKNKNLFWRVFSVSLFIGVILFGLATLRHHLFHSNGYDLGLFDQWLWQLANGVKPFSSMLGLHVLADHGAWILYPFSLLYKLSSNIHWLFITQSFSLAFTSIPLAFIAKESGLNKRNTWLICCLWWLQPIVFNVNLFDFHPEVLIIPLFALSYWFVRNNKYYLWITSLILILGARDGLLLIVLGLGIEQLLRRRYLWGISSITISIIWLIFLTNYLYPILNKGLLIDKNIDGDSTTILAISRFSYLGDSINEIIRNIIFKPSLLFNGVMWSESLFYLFILFLPFILLWNRHSIITLTSSIPLLIVNIIADNPSMKTLIHQYSLPFAVIGTIAAIDALSSPLKNYISIKKNFLWILLSWALLAKPTFFLGPYLSRLDDLSSLKNAINEVPDNSRVLTTSYIIPHLSHRNTIDWPRVGSQSSVIKNYDLILLNPRDPGWSSNESTQRTILDAAKDQSWSCDFWDNGLALCKK